MSPEANSQVPVIVCGADDAFAMPLAVTLTSAIVNLGEDRRLSVFILDGGLSDVSLEKILSLRQLGEVTIEVLKPDLAIVKRLPILGHVNFCTYLRMLLADVLPESVERAIYLDSDLVVRADLTTLWNQHFAGAWCQAVQEVTAPVMDARLGLPSYKQCARYLSTIRAVPNYRDFGFAPSKKYFNAGVLVVDVAQWRQDRISEKFLKCLDDNRASLRWEDQYALNVVLADRMGELDPRWNQTWHIYVYPSWDRSPLDQATFEQLRTDPFIVHFNARRKPWHLGCQHPWREEFFRYVDMTPWAGFRPARRPWNFRRWRRERVEDLLVFAGRRYRQMTAWFS